MERKQKRRRGHGRDEDNKLGRRSEWRMEYHKKGHMPLSTCTNAVTLHALHATARPITSTTHAGRIDAGTQGRRNALTHGRMDVAHRLSHSPHPKLVVSRLHYLVNESTTTTCVIFLCSIFSYSSSRLQSLSWQDRERVRVLLAAVTQALYLPPPPPPALPLPSLDVLLVLVPTSFPYSFSLLYLPLFFSHLSSLSAFSALTLIKVLKRKTTTKTKTMTMIMTMTRTLVTCVTMRTVALSPWTMRARRMRTSEITRTRIRYTSLYITMH